MGHRNQNNKDDGGGRRRRTSNNDEESTYSYFGTTYSNERNVPTITAQHDSAKSIDKIDERRKIRTEQNEESTNVLSNQKDRRANKTKDNPHRSEEVSTIPLIVPLTRQQQVSVVIRPGAVPVPGIFYNNNIIDDVPHPRSVSTPTTASPSTRPAMSSVTQDDCNNSTLVDIEIGQGSRNSCVRNDDNDASDHHQHVRVNHVPDLSSRSTLVDSRTRTNTKIVVAEGILADDLDEAVRRRMMAEAECAEVVDVSKIRRIIFVCSLVLLAVILVLLVMSVVLVQIHQEDQQNVNTEHLKTVLRTASQQAWGSHDEHDGNQTTEADWWTHHAGLDDPESPQYQAYQILASSMVHTIPNANTHPQEMEELLENYALTTLYFSTGKTFDWEDVAPYNIPCQDLAWANPQFPHCYGNGPVLHLDLSQQHLTGTLPPELVFLSHLQSFNMSGNAHLTGSIPTEILQMTQLQVLDLSYTPNLEAKLPANLMNELKQLQYLSVHCSGIEDVCDDDNLKNVANTTSFTCCDNDSSRITDNTIGGDRMC